MSCRARIQHTLEMTVKKNKTNLGDRQKAKVARAQVLLEATHEKMTADGCSFFT